MQVMLVDDHNHGRLICTTSRQYINKQSDQNGENKASYNSVAHSSNQGKGRTEADARVTPFM